MIQTFLSSTAGCLSGVVLTGAAIPHPGDAPKSQTPEQSAAAFKLPPGFRMEVVASEPLIASPTGVCWDEQGRMFVTEFQGYVEQLNKTAVSARRYGGCKPMINSKKQPRAAGDCRSNLKAATQKK